MSKRGLVYFASEGNREPMSTWDAAELASSLKPVSGWGDLIGRRIVGLFTHDDAAFMVFDDAYAMFSAGIEGVGVEVKKVKRKGKKDKRSHQARIDDSLGGTIVDFAPKPRDPYAVRFTLSNGAVIDVGGEIDRLRLFGDEYMR